MAIMLRALSLPAPRLVLSPAFSFCPSDRPAPLGNYLWPVLAKVARHFSTIPARTRSRIYPFPALGLS